MNMMYQGPQFQAASCFITRTPFREGRRTKAYKWYTKNKIALTKTKNNKQIRITKKQASPLKQNYFKHGIYGKHE